jgi:hypothetical protein
MVFSLYVKVYLLNAVSACFLMYLETTGDWNLEP